MNKEILKTIINYRVKKIFISVYPPFGEKNIADVDIKIGLVIENNLDYMYVIDTSKEDLWTPIFRLEPICKSFFGYKDFYTRIKKWMSQDLDNPFVLENYDFTMSEFFNNIVDNKILDIKILFIKGNTEPFGVKFFFENDFILSFPSVDGNTVETKKFNTNNNLNNFTYLGDITYTPLSEV